MQNAKEFELYELQKKREEDELRRKKNSEMRKIVQEWKNVKTASEHQEKLEKMLLKEKEKKIR